MKDYDEAIQFYTEKLGFVLLEDTRLIENKRWVLVAPAGENQCSLLLAKASNDKQIGSVGNQAGGRVFLFIYTDDFWADYNKMRERGIHFINAPRQEEYGMGAVFEDLYGNLWDLIQPRDLEKV